MSEWKYDVSSKGEAALDWVKYNENLEKKEQPSIKGHFPGVQSMFQSSTTIMMGRKNHRCGRTCKTSLRKEIAKQSVQEALKAQDATLRG